MGPALLTTPFTYAQGIGFLVDQAISGLTGDAEDHDGVGPECGPVRERGADGPVALGRDGDHHEDGAGDGEPLEGVQHVGEGHAVPQRLGQLQGTDEGPHDAVVHQVVQQEEGVHQRCNGMSQYSKYGWTLDERYGDSFGN